MGPDPALTGPTKGSLHIHREPMGWTLDRLVAEHRARGYSFIGVTEHPKDVDEEAYLQDLADAQQLSRGGFLCVMGLEGPTADGPHLLGLGARQFVPLQDLTVHDAALALRAAGAVVVLAHPRPAEVASLDPGAAGRFDGIEVWNGLRAGWAPDARVLSVLAKVPSLRGLPHWGGSDAHRPSQLFKVDTLVGRQDASDPARLLEALRAGRFHLRRGALAHRTGGASAAVRTMSVLSRTHTAVLRGGYRWVKRRGVRVPDRLKGRLERTQ